MAIKREIDRFIDCYPWLHVVRVDCSPIGGRRVFGPNPYRGKELQFVGASRATKLRKEAEREASFKESQQDAFQSSVGNEGAQA